MSDANPLAVDQQPLDLDPAEVTVELPADPPPWMPASEANGEVPAEQVASAAGKHHAAACRALAERSERRAKEAQR